MTDRLPPLRSELDELIRETKAGGSGSLRSFQALVSTMLQLTVIADGHAPRLWYLPDSREAATLGGVRAFNDPLPLRNGAYLRLTMNLRLAERQERWLKVGKSSYQYQLRPEDESWVFRYDFLRHRESGRHPQGHLQVHGQFTEPEAAPRPMGRLHFPVIRPSIEGVIRVLAEDFEVPTREPAEVWRPLLALTEDTLFGDVADKPVSGPRE